MPRWLTLDTSVRERMEYQSAIDFRLADAPVYGLTRFRAGARIHPNDWIVLYLQVQDARSFALAPDDIAMSMKDTFDLRQALISLKSGKVQLILGRQPLRFGDERLVGMSDWTNVSRTFDAIDLRYGKDNRVDLFTSSVVNICATCFDRSQGGLHFHGAVGSLNAWIPHTSVSPYVYGKTSQGVRSRAGNLGMEKEFTVGAFEAGNLTFHVFHSARIAMQKGSYAGEPIDALGGIARVGYIFQDLPWAPELRVA